MFRRRRRRRRSRTPATRLRALGGLAATLAAAIAGYLAAGAKRRRQGPGPSVADPRAEARSMPDVLEQQQPVGAEPAVGAPPADPEVPSPDALEQARAVEATATQDEPSRAVDAPDADALEQAAGAPSDEDERT